LGQITIQRHKPILLKKVDLKTLILKVHFYPYLHHVVFVVIVLSAATTTTMTITITPTTTATTTTTTTTTTYNISEYFLI